MSTLSYCVAVFFYAEIELVSKNKESPSRVTVHTVQLPPLTSFSSEETCHTLKIDCNGSSTIIVPITVECVHVYVSVCLCVGAYI